MTKKMKIERKDMFDRMIAKRLEIVREKLRMKEYKKKLRKGKKVLYAQNHGKLSLTSNFFTMCKVSNKDNRTSCLYC